MAMAAAFDGIKSWIKLELHNFPRALRLLASSAKLSILIAKVGK